MWRALTPEPRERSRGLWRIAPWRGSLSTSTVIASAVLRLAVPRLLHATRPPVSAHRPLAARTGAPGAIGRHVPRIAHGRAGRRGQARHGGGGALADVTGARLGSRDTKAAADPRVVDRGVAAVLVLRHEGVVADEVDVAPVGRHTVEEVGVGALPRGDQREAAVPPLIDVAAVVAIGGDQRVDRLEEDRAAVGGDAGDVGEGGDR